MNKNRLLLVNPVNSGKTGFSVNRSSRFPPLALGIIADLTPESWSVELVDENVEPFAYRDADLVGLTAFTSSVNRAYKIAELYRQRGVPVVMGGIHASMCPDEALQFADAVVVGEVETAWPQVMEDFAAGKLQTAYHGDWPDLAHLGSVRRDLFDDGYLFASMQTSRGCPLDCDFCSVTAYNGRRYRRRPPNEVLDELETIPQRLLFFVDDNIVGYGSESRQQAITLFKGIVDRGIEKSWFCQASVNIGDDPELLEWAARAGCKMIFIGIEAEDVDALAEVNKRLNLKRGVSAYDEAFDRVHQAGIAVLGAFIFGMDGDTPEKLRRRADYMIHSGVDVMQTTVLTPLPGTQLFQRLEDEGRLLYTNFPEDWDRYNFNEVVHQPIGMGREELSEIMRECVRRMYDLPVLKEKAKAHVARNGKLGDNRVRLAGQCQLPERRVVRRLLRVARHRSADCGRCSAAAGWC